MARVEIVRYKCDVCGKEFESEKSVTTTVIPCYGGERNNYLTEASMDLCEECSKVIRKVIYDNFAEINDYYGLQVRKKF